MEEVVISVKEVSKRYRIGVADERKDTLAGQIGQLLLSPFKNFKRLIQLKNFKDTDASNVSWALKNVNFEVNRGEVLGIIGHNGAGKSTLLKILSRITEPTEGEIQIKGRVSSLLEVGTGFHPELSGRENVYMNGTILGMTKKEIDAKFDEIVEFSGIGKYLDTPVKFYSSGMKVRLAFSVAAHLEPEILIIDEVLAVGDAEFQNKCLGKMNEVANSGRTVLFVSHNIAAVKSLCSRSIVLKGGMKIFDGLTKDGIDNYLDSSAENVGNENVNNGFRLSRLTFRSLTNSEIFYVNDNFVITGNIEGDFPSDNLTLLVLFKTVFGVRALNLSTRLHGVEIKGLDKVLNFKVTGQTLNLMPSVYYLEIKVLRMNGEPIVSFDNAFRLNIEPSSDFLPILLPSYEDRGVLYKRVSFLINQD
ncbi:MAG: ABC transporter ATP-binding protein [Fulvivirga sp.]|uniref:ABC transporter ATP-binding protein n=1 Tax=Fulvivirga sp. TaxID=1931237 RepID=UPI0032EDAC97